MSQFMVGSGVSRLDDARSAGHDAAEIASRALGGQQPALVLVYASMRYDLTDLLAGVRSVTGDAPLVGSTGSGQFARGEMIAPGEGVCVLVLAGDRYRFGVASVDGLRETPYPAGQQLAEAARAAVGPERREHAALLVLADGLAGDLQNLLNGIYQIAGSKVPVVGGAAGADRELDATFVFHDGQALSNTAVAVWIDADRPLRVAVGHGWRSVGLPMLVTHTDGSIVHELGGRPALEVYQEGFRPEDIPADADPEWIQGFHATRAFGLLEPDGTEIVRGAYVDENNVVRTFTPLPPYCAVRIMTATPDELLGISEEVVAAALHDRQTDSDHQVLLAFGCAARMEILKDRAHEEAERLQKAAGPVPVIGFYTYGEFARDTGVSGYHNATLAALAL